MNDLQQICLLLLGVAKFMIIVHVIMSLLINFNIINLHQPLIGGIWQGLERLFAPIYGPLRRVLPDTRPLDLSPLAALLIIYVLEILIV